MEQEINAAVAWWCQRLREQPNHNTGDADLNFCIHMFTFEQYEPLPEEKIQAFSTALRELLLTAPPNTISTDYAPEDELRDATRLAGIDHAEIRFPIKTVMWLEDGCVSVKCGYGAPFETIYQG